MKPLNINLFKPLFAILAVALACVCMWGCGDMFREDGEKEFTGHYIKGNAKVVGFIDDSLVIVYDFQYWNQDLADGTQITGTGKQRLRVFNYRVQEDGPRWADTLDNMTEVYDYVKGQLSDSAIWGGNGRNTFSFWKLGEEPVAYGVSINKEGCDVDYSVRALRPWLNGDIIALGEETINADGNSCQYAILDTTAKIITYKRLDKDLEWIKQCDDVRAWDNDVYCVILDDENANSVVLKNEKDTIPMPIKFAIGGFWGDMLKLSGKLCSFKNDIAECGDVIWYGNEIKFYRNNEVVVEY